jgi:hypothetical protein
MIYAEKPDTINYRVSTRYGVIYTARRCLSFLQVGNPSRFSSGSRGKGSGAGARGRDNFGSVLETFREKAGGASLANEGVREEAPFLHKSA